ncbi:MAG TPA: hypothetical protein VFX22_00655, partial [Candidatus Kapabacteria bacterium]|nr:hypothetical protein [Candidatus Kapabacteria bacterium]
LDVARINEARMPRSEEYLQQWKELADSGDADAQIVMAWEYIKGRRVPKDLDRAVALFRAAEPTKGRLARFNLGKAMIFADDASFADVLREDCEAGFGPALYLMGVAEARGKFGSKNVDQAIRYFSLAARDNHLLSEVFAWRLQKKSILQWVKTFPHGMRLMLKVAVLEWRDRNDLRILS